MEEKLLKGPDIVLSTRVRIARNLSDYKFPSIMDKSEIDEITDRVFNILDSSKDHYEFYRVKDLDTREKLAFMEDHLISPDLVNSPWKGSFFLSEDRKTTIMLNEEDHIRIQVIVPGFNMEEAWKRASYVDDFIEKDVDYAFHEKFGFMTSCPTNVGTGLRASFMLHLPALQMTNNLEGMNEVLRRVGLTMRGLYGEGTKGIGSIYQISNQTTLGQSEEEIMNKLIKIISQVISREAEMRDYLKTNLEVDLEDRVLRSYGILKYNKKLSSEEAMAHLSNIKLGGDMGILPDIDSKEIIKLMRKIQPANLQLNLDRELTSEGRNIERSRLIRKSL